MEGTETAKTASLVGQPYLLKCTRERFPFDDHTRRGSPFP